MPKPPPSSSSPGSEEWSTRDFAFAARELQQEYPRASSSLILAALQTAAKRISPSSGRVRLVQIVRQVLREH